MTLERLTELIDEGHEIEYQFNGHKYSITYGIENGKEVISFCEFNQETTEVETITELISVNRNGFSVLEMITSIEEKDIWIF